MPKKPAGRSRKTPGRAPRAAPPTRTARAKSARTGGAGRRVVEPRPSRTPRSAVRPVTRPPVTKAVVAKVVSTASARIRPLTKRDLDEFRRLLEAERERLANELEIISDRMPEVEQVSVDASGGYDEALADVASETFEREKGIAIEQNVNHLLQQVEEALVRLDEGTFGTCQVCGQPIHRDRLKALPYARLCIQCKAREEQAIPR